MERLWLVVMLLFVGGCAVGNQYDYRAAAISLPVKAAAPTLVAVTVQDLRPYVVSGEKNANFVGLQRGGFGNPFAVTTRSGQPLTTDMAAAIVRALNAAGYQAIDLGGETDTAKLLDKARQQGATRLLWLLVREWKSDVFMAITLHCDLVLKILNEQGEVLAESSMAFVEGIGGAQIGGEKNSAAVTREFAKRIGYLFNRDEVRTALQ